MKLRFNYNWEEGTVSNLEVSLNTIDYDKIQISETSLPENISDAIQKYLDDLASNGWLDI